MAKLYPPTIAGTIPAFYGTSIEVPFSMNRAVSVNEIGGFVLKIKKVSGTLVDTVKTYVASNNPVKFDLSHLNLTVGEYYKVQLAYLSLGGNDVGYFSTVGVVKYTSEPTIEIVGLDKLTSNNHNYSYTGVYRQAKISQTILDHFGNEVNVYSTEGYDTSEKLYSSRFVLYDENGAIVKDSGERLHSVNKDTYPYEANEEYTINEDFDIDKPFFLQFIGTTSNGLVCKSPRYQINQKRQRPMMLEAHLEVSSDFETGTIKVFLVQDVEEVTSGSFLLSRASSREPNKWDPMKYFSLQSEYPSRLLYIDYTVEQGITYTYSLQQYNENQIYSERKLSQSIMADFEDLFLYDGDRQLTVRFNPKVSTYKENHVEQKQDSIGSKYPFIIRNGIVQYKELAISGLISYQMDEMERFLSKEDLELVQYKYTRSSIDPIQLNSNEARKLMNQIDLVTANIKAERIFKNEVLSWLNNGETKLFRSPTEGNFVVRLMNINLSPNDTLGRMLHTFTCTAYEIADYTYENLQDYGLLISDNESNQIMRWKTIDLQVEQIAKDEEFRNNKFMQINHGKNLGISVVLPVFSLDFQGLVPGSYFVAGENEHNYETFYIGSTGSYHIDVESPFDYVGIPINNPDGSEIQWQGLFTFGYKGWVKSSFDLITNVQIIDEPGRRFIGNAYQLQGKTNILDCLSDIKVSVLAVKYCKFYSRVLKPLYIDSSGYFYLTEDGMVHGGKPICDLKELDQWAIYKLFHTRRDYYEINNENYYLDSSFEETPPYLDEKGAYCYLDPALEYYKRTHSVELSGLNCPLITGDSEYEKTHTNPCNIYNPRMVYNMTSTYNEMTLYEIHINDETSNLYDISQLVIRNLEDWNTISIGAGIILDIGYQKQVSTYNFETQDAIINECRRKLYVVNNNLLESYIKDRRSFGVDPTNSFRKFNDSYDVFINYLTEAVQSYKEENEIVDE